MDANEVLNVEDREDHSERKDAEQWLREYLADGPVGASDVVRAANAAGITKSTLWRAAHSLSVARRKIGGRGAGWEWSLQDSKNPTPIYTNLDSLNSLTNQMKTKSDARAKNSKNSSVEYIGPVYSLPLADDPNEDGEIRL